MPLDFETIEYVAERVKNYISASRYKHVVLVEDPAWKGRISSSCADVKRKGLSMIVLSVRKTLTDEVLDSVMKIIQEMRV